MNYMRLFLNLNQRTFDDNLEFFNRPSMNFWGFDLVYKNRKLYIIKTKQDKDTTYTVYYLKDTTEINDIVSALKFALKLRNQGEAELRQFLYNEMKELESFHRTRTLQDFYSTKTRILLEK